MIILLDNYDSFTYNLYQALALHDKDVRIIRNDAVTVADIVSLKPHGIVISPGPGRPEQGGIGIELIKMLAPEVPILGVCLGHQMITVAFGGKVVLAEQAIHGKQALIFHQRSGLYRDMPLPFRAGRYHSLIAERDSLPNELIVEAESEQGLIMGIRHQSFPTYGVQFHPESILTPEGELLLRNFVKLALSYKPVPVAVNE